MERVGKLHVRMFCLSCCALPLQSLRAPPRADPGEAGVLCSCAGGGRERGFATSNESTSRLSKTGKGAGGGGGVGGLGMRHLGTVTNGDVVC